LRRFFLKDFFRFFGFNGYKKFSDKFSLKLKRLTPASLTSEAIARHVWLKLRKKYSFGVVVQGLLRTFKQLRLFSGITFRCNGRFTKKQKAWHSFYRWGKIPLSSQFSFVDDFLIPVRLKYGIASVRINIHYKEKKEKKRKVRYGF